MVHNMLILLCSDIKKTLEYSYMFMNMRPIKQCFIFKNNVAIHHEGFNIEMKTFLLYIVKLINKIN